ncbi:MAG: 3'-5' exonuclease [Gammaproteobacteria bacterium]|nr:3'-5' exonuclease [Gammaproteobacteria bacterium]
MEKLNLTNTYILDTETTGLDSNAEIVEISLIDAVSGDVVFTSLVNPCNPIPDEAKAIHGISNDDVRLSTNFKLVWEQIETLLDGKSLIIYNSDYDIRLICQSLLRFCSSLYVLEIQEMLMDKSHCAMLWYAEFYADWNDYHENYKWQSLTNACRQQGIDTSDLTAHRALADCEMTRRLVHAVNAKLEA